VVCLATPQGWPTSSESVAGLRRNQWPEWIGITGRFASEYAHVGGCSHISEQVIELRSARFVSCDDFAVKYRVAYIE